MVRNQVPFLDEWIGFHVLQGFREVRVYDDASTDGSLELVRRWSSSRASKGMAVAGISMTDLGQRYGPNFADGTHRRGDPCTRQWIAFKACSLHSRSASFDWVAIHDVDEFVYTQRGTIAEYVATVPLDVTQVLVQEFRFGPSTRGKLGDPAGLVIQRHRQRAPYVALGEYATIESLKRAGLACSSPFPSRQPSNLYCGKRDMTKAIWRTRRGCIGHIHEASGCRPNTTLLASPHDVRGNHYGFRGLADVRAKTRAWVSADAFEQLDWDALAYRNAVNDTGILSWFWPLRQLLQVHHNKTKPTHGHGCQGGMRDG